MRFSFCLSFVFCTLIFAQNGFSSPLAAKNEKAGNEKEPLEWWKQTVVYQIYPRSFQDSDGDGVGDLNGITSRLDYLVELGIDSAWISPIYESPMKDFGYDISNFTNVDPAFGTLDDFRRMSQEFRKRNMKIVMDMVPNHSSDLHQWFIKSVQKIEPYTDYYVWRNASGTDAQGKPLPPNNWIGIFGGSMWEWNEQRQQFYLHQFVKEQPDLNFENIKVRNEILAVVKFWLEMGVDGFRVDAVPHLYEDQRYLDEPENPDRDPSWKPDEYRYWNHPYTYNLPAVLDYLADLRQLLDIYSAADGKVRVMMVESGVPDEFVMDYYGDAQKPIAHFPFNFHLSNVNENTSASRVLELINVWYDLMPENEWACFLLGNHDQKRAATKWTKGGVDGANMINLLLKGTAVTYYGEEIGMEDTYLTWEQTIDPAGCNTDPERYQEFSRDPARTPMQWDNSTASGFSTSSKTWLPVNSNYKTLNVAAQEGAEESHLSVYKALMKLRNSDVWRYGDYESKVLNQDNAIGFTRIGSFGDEQSFLVLMNLSKETQTVDATVFKGVPSSGTVYVRSVGFQSSTSTIGSNIDLRKVPLGPRNSVVVLFDSI